MDNVTVILNAHPLLSHIVPVLVFLIVMILLQLLFNPLHKPYVEVNGDIYYVYIYYAGRGGSGYSLYCFAKKGNGYTYLIDKNRLTIELIVTGLIATPFLLFALRGGDDAPMSVYCSILFIEFMAIVFLMHPVWARLLIKQEKKKQEDMP